MTGNKYVYECDFFKIFPGFFENLIFELEDPYIRMGMRLAKQLMSPQKMFSVLIFGSPVCTPLIPCHHYWTSDDLDCNNIQKHGEQTVLQNHPHDEDKGVREETIFLIFRRNIVLHDSYQRWNCDRDWGMEIKSSKRLCQKL